MLNMLASSGVDHEFKFMLASSGVDHEFKLRSAQTKDYKTDICCFSTKNAVLKSKNKYWFVQNKDYVSKWTSCCLPTDLFQ